MTFTWSSFPPYYIAAPAQDTVLVVHAIGLLYEWTLVQHGVTLAFGFAAGLIEAERKACATYERWTLGLLPKQRGIKITRRQR